MPRELPGNVEMQHLTRKIPFPFPALEEGELKTQIRELGERLDAHRKARQALLTGMYNVLEELRGGDLRSPSPLTDKERKIHDDGLVTVLKQIHDDLDAAIFQAYGWDEEQQRMFRHLRRITRRGW